MKASVRRVPARLFLSKFVGIFNKDIFVRSRETREGWPLLTVETELQSMGTQRVQMKGSFLCWFVGLVVPVQDFFVQPCLLQSAQYKIFFSSPYIISIHLSPSPNKLGRQSCWITCFLVCVSG